MIKKMLHINGVPKTVIAESETMLADVLREQLGLTGTKVGCGQGQCGSCSVILDGKVVRSCITKMKRVADGARVTTIEGIGTPDNLHPLQMAWIVHGGAQCGFCSPGFIVSAKALLDENPEPHARSRSATGSRSTATPAAAPATSRWWTRSWTRPRCCAAR